MSKTNCPNCGAPYDLQLNKCPYCGTSYFDMSCIDIDGGEPFYLKLKMNGMTITQKVLVDPNVSISVDTDYSDLTDCYGNIVKRIVLNRSCTTDLTFHAIDDSNGALYSVQMEK